MTLHNFNEILFNLLFGVSPHSISYADHRIRLLLTNEKQQRLDYDSYKKKYANNMAETFGKDDDSENKKFRKELDKERERKLSQGLNHKNLRKKFKRDKDKKNKTKKRDKDKKSKKKSNKKKDRKKSKRSKDKDKKRKHRKKDKVSNPFYIQLSLIKK